MDRAYGWRRQAYDPRDLLLTVAAPAALPAHVDLRGHMPAVYDQGQLGSCTANAIGAAYAFELGRQGLPTFTPSRLAIYYQERLLEHTTRTDSGAAIRDSAKVVAKYGAPHEDLWPYDPTRFKRKPTANVTADAALHRASRYEAVPQTLDAMRACLAAGRPFVLGFTVYASFESQAVARTGQVPMPTPGEQTLGGHAVVAVGYDDTIQRFMCRNSWGPSWGQAGYFAIPYAYLTNPQLASDFWTLEVVE